jgi:hypothetical protein
VEVSREQGDEKKQWIIGIWKSKKCGAGICNRLKSKRNREKTNYDKNKPRVSRGRRKE